MFYSQELLTHLIHKTIPDQLRPKGRVVVQDTPLCPPQCSIPPTSSSHKENVTAKPSAENAQGRQGPGLSRESLCLLQEPAPPLPCSLKASYQPTPPPLWRAIQVAPQKALAMKFCTTMSVETKTTTCHSLNEVNWGQDRLQPTHKWASTGPTGWANTT